MNYIRKNPDTSRPEISQNTGLSMASITNITSHLLEKGLIKECGIENADRVGRKSTLLRFNHESYGLICVCITSGGISFSYTDLKGNIISRICLDRTDDKDNLLQITTDNIINLISQYKDETILAISISVSGIILNYNHFVLSSSLRLKDIDFVTVLESKTDIPVLLNNITYLKATWCFNRMNQSGSDNMIFIDLDEGIGACQFYNGEINMAMLGEIGHTTVEKDGEPCFCGNHGCLEAMCSRERILRLYKENSKNYDADLTFEKVVQKYYSGDVYAYAAVDNCAQYLGIAFANLINLFKPTSLVINVGDFISLRDIIEKAKHIMHERAYPALLHNIIIQEVNIGVEQSTEGAAWMACDRLFSADNQIRTVDLL